MGNSLRYQTLRMAGTQANIVYNFPLVFFFFLILVFEYIINNLIVFHDFICIFGTHHLNTSHKRRADTNCIVLIALHELFHGNSMRNEYCYYESCFASGRVN